MGLMDHRHLNKTGPVGRIVASVFMILMFVVPFIYYIKGIIDGDLGIGLAILFGFMLLFYCPFTLIGGFYEIVESIEEIKKKKK